MKACTGTVISTLHVTLLIHMTALRAKYFYYPHFSNEEIEAQRCATVCPRLNQQEKAELALEVTLPGFRIHYFSNFCALSPKFQTILGLAI